MVWRTVLGEACFILNKFKWPSLRIVDADTVYLFRGQVFGVMVKIPHGVPTICIRVLGLSPGFFNSNPPS